MEHRLEGNEMEGLLGNLSEELLKIEDPDLVDRYLKNKRIDEPACTILIHMYVILIILGALGNALVVSETLQL